MNVITYKDGEGVAIIYPTSSALKKMSIDDIAKKDTPKNTDYDVVSVDALPSDWTFRKAWKKDNETKLISTDMTKAKDIAHEMRREKRAAELAPLDIDATIPEKAQNAESERKLIRKKYEDMQVMIDGAIDEKSLKKVLTDNGVL